MGAGRLGITCSRAQKPLAAALLPEPRARHLAPGPEGGSGVGADAANGGGRGDYAERENEQDPHHDLGAFCGLGESWCVVSGVVGCVWVNCCVCVCVCLVVAGGLGFDGEEGSCEMRLGCGVNKLWGLWGPRI